MNIRLKKWQHSALSILLLMGFVFLLIELVVWPAYQDKQSMRSRITELTMQKNKYSQIEKELADIKINLKQTKAVIPYKDFFLEEQPASLAAADLQNLLKTIIQNNQGTLVSTQPDITQSDAQFPEIIIKLQLRGSTEVLLNTLYQIENAGQKLFIENLSIQNRTIKTTRSQQDNNTLDIKMDVTGYIYNSNI